MIWYSRVRAIYWATTVRAKDLGNLRVLVRRVAEFTQFSAHSDYFGGEHCTDGVTCPAQSAALFAMALGDNDGRPTGGIRDLATKAFSCVCFCHLSTLAVSSRKRNCKSLTKALLSRPPASNERFELSLQSFVQSVASGKVASKPTCGDAERCSVIAPMNGGSEHCRHGGSRLRRMTGHRRLPSPDPAARSKTTSRLSRS